MRIPALLAGAALLAVSAPASAQLGAVGGSLGGNVQGSLGGRVTSPDVGRVTAPARRGVQDTVRTTRGTAGDARTIGRNAAADVRQSRARVDADVAAGGAADLRSGRAAGAATGYAGLDAGVMVRSRAGENIGEVASVVRNRAGQVTRILVRTADGTVRSLPPAGVSVQGGVAVTNYSAAELGKAPRG